MDEEPRMAASARKCGVGDEAITHAFNNPIRTVDVDDDVVVFIGADHAGNLYEIGVVNSSSGPVVIHARAARSQFLE
jgi:hypothetical protein